MAIWNLLLVLEDSNWVIFITAIAELLIADLDKFQGTIFQFPVRRDKQHDKSSFTPHSMSYKYTNIRVHLNSRYYDQARRNVIMLQRINNIEFRRRVFNYHTRENITRSMWKIMSQHRTSTIEDHVGEFKQIK